MAQRLSRAEFINQWELAQLEVMDLLDRGIKLANILPSIYEGVLGEEAPERMELMERLLDRKRERSA